MKLLSHLTRIVYLEMPVSIQREMYDLYRKDPKPVIWGDSFYIKNGETDFNVEKFMEEI